MIGRYAVENGPTRVSKHFSKLLRKNISEPTAQRFKNEYLLKLKELLKEKPEEKPSIQTRITEVEKVSCHHRLFPRSDNTRNFRLTPGEQYHYSNGPTQLYG